MAGVIARFKLRDSKMANAEIAQLLDARSLDPFNYPVGSSDGKIWEGYACPFGEYGAVNRKGDVLEIQTGPSADRWCQAAAQFADQV
jgi:hypothetical protein